MSWQEISKRGGLAVITGGASGVGLAAAELLAGRGFHLLLADQNAEALETAATDLRASGARVETQVVDVSDAHAVNALADQAFAMGRVAVVMNNAGIGLGSSCWDDPEAWRKTFDVNFFGIVNGVQAFVPRLIDAGEPAAIINTGSKQGITTPPGNPAYNASKAAVKVLTEQLAHELREAGAPIDVHLFVPGFTYTGMIAAIMPEKPEGAWTSAQCVEYLFDRVGRGDFYVLCPDNMVDETVDERRVLWAAGDIAENRPALSRWHPDWAEAFSAFEKG
ncbi:MULTISPECIES: SDR family NAD(P)-dependent oxidoreductase [unclassified Roseobacter]|uniref:SDR family NAD(P)-dependent oxidoreductase n=1 Tax=unclassified Roseobacter TaxID=196798 RepID=UPI0018A2531B|nr:MULTISPECIES: SDR family NAD(P)-dependent oxidoreductase [unclassified Roseobacter]MDW3183593.1 SDR family NAD(P)-dependent oxidoreductase [Roseobacter sp.]